MRARVAVAAVILLFAVTSCSDTSSPAPTFDVDGRKPVAWKLVGPQPASSDTKIKVEAAWIECTSGSEPDDPKPAIAYGENTISITIWAIPPAGDAFDCQGNPSIPVTISLNEPVGDRDIVQGHEKPY
jgi:hypothetical protein